MSKEDVSLSLSLVLLDLLEVIALYQSISTTLAQHPNIAQKCLSSSFGARSLNGSL
jgi:hypothetical protein